MGRGLGIKNPLFPIRVLCKFHLQNNKEFSVVDIHLYILISITFLEVLGTTSRAKNRYYFYFRSLDPEKENCDIYDMAWRAEYLTDDTYKHLVAQVCIDITASLPTILLNSLVIFAVVTRQRLRNNSTILLACLAGTDLFTGLVVLPLAFSLDLKRLLGVGPFCSPEKALNVIITISIFASLGHLVVISIDRFIAIKYPLRYLDIVTEERIKISIILAWAIALIMSISELALALIDSKSIYLIYSVVNSVTQSGTGILFIITISLSYGYIYSETRRQLKRLKTEQLPQEQVQRIKKDRRAAITLAIVLITLVITYLPAIIVSLVTASSDSILVKPRFIAITFSWVGIPMMLGSLCNPIIYCWRMKKLRNAFLEILHLRNPENTVPEAEITGTQPLQPGPTFCRTDQAFPSRGNEQPALMSFRQQPVECLPRIEEANGE